MKFEKPIFEIVDFDTDDIIRTSILFDATESTELPGVGMDD